MTKEKFIAVFGSSLRNIDPWGSPDLMDAASRVALDGFVFAPAENERECAYVNLKRLVAYRDDIARRINSAS